MTSSPAAFSSAKWRWNHDLRCTAPTRRRRRSPCGGRTSGTASRRGRCARRSRRRCGSEALRQRPNRLRANHAPAPFASSAALPILLPSSSLRLGKRFFDSNPSRISPHSLAWWTSTRSRSPTILDNPVMRSIVPRGEACRSMPEPGVMRTTRRRRSPGSPRAGPSTATSPRGGPRRLRRAVCR